MPEWYKFICEHCKIWVMSNVPYCTNCGRIMGNIPWDNDPRKTATLVDKCSNPERRTEMSKYSLDCIHYAATYLSGEVACSNGGKINLVWPKDCRIGCPSYEPRPKKVEDPVNHPPHYTSHPSGVECIQITEHMNFCIGNAIKYLFRCDQKGNAIEDLRKARWYVDREIARRQKADGKQVNEITTECDWKPVFPTTIFGDSDEEEKYDYE